MPMRANGKYKDLIKRAKGETTLQQEALQRAKRLQEEYVKQMLEKRQRDLLAGAALKITQDQMEAERKQRILNLLLGGKKGNAKKFFKAWIKGMETMKQERKNRERDGAWRRSCRCSPGEHSGACFAAALQDPVYQLPCDTLRQTGSVFFAGEGGHFRGSASMPDLMTTHRRNSGLTGPIMPQFRASPEGPAPAFLVGEPTAVAHHATGRKCFVDSMRRMVLAPEIKISSMATITPDQRMASYLGFAGYAVNSGTNAPLASTIGAEGMAAIASGVRGAS